MVLADWQVGEVFLSFLWFFMFFIWIWLLITVFADIFRDHEMSGWAKAAWVIFVIIFPYLGVFVYLIARGGSMAQRAAKQQQQAQQQFDSYVQSVATTGSTADELARLADLKSKGVISDAEFEQLKAKAIG
jgi:ABC-type multidrug transport system fused ATPase/permease subunit